MPFCKDCSHWRRLQNDPNAGECFGKPPEAILAPGKDIGFVNNIAHEVPTIKQIGYCRLQTVALTEACDLPVFEPRKTEAEQATAKFSLPVA